MASLSVGANIVKAKLKSGAGIWGSIGSFTINVDLTAPTVTEFVVDTGDGGQSVASADLNSIRLIATNIEDTDSGVKTTKFYWSNDEKIWKDEVVYNGAQLSHTYEEIDIHYPTVYGKVVVEDNAGNITTETAEMDVQFIGMTDFSARIKFQSGHPRQSRGRS